LKESIIAPIHNTETKLITGNEEFLLRIPYKILCTIFLAQLILFVNDVKLIFVIIDDSDIIADCLSRLWWGVFNTGENGNII
jgi:hypothetical protein